MYSTCIGEQGLDWTGVGCCGKGMGAITASYARCPFRWLHLVIFVCLTTEIRYPQTTLNHRIVQYVCSVCLPPHHNSLVCVTFYVSFRLSGMNIPVPIVSTKNWLRLHFVTDSNHRHKGFTAQYQGKRTSQWHSTGNDSFCMLTHIFLSFPWLCQLSLFHCWNVAVPSSWTAAGMQQPIGLVHNVPRWQPLEKCAATTRVMYGI